MKQKWSKRWIMILLSCGILLSGCGAQEDENQQESPEPTISEAQESTVPIDDGKLYTTEGFTCQNGALTISGKIFTPKEAEGKLPVVILSHGYSSTMTTVQSYATDLAKNGYISVCFDFCGGAANSTSDGDTTQMSIFTEKEDLKAVIEEVRQLDAVDIERLYLLGASQGGAVSAMVASELVEQISGLVLLYPAFSAADDARNTYGSLDEVPETVNFMGMEIGRVYYEGLFDYDPYTEIAQYTGPVLLLHGTSDSTVAYEYSARAAETYTNATLVTYEGAGHGFWSETLTESQEAIRIFLAINGALG